MQYPAHYEHQSSNTTQGWRIRTQLRNAQAGSGEPEPQEPDEPKEPGVPEDPGVPEEPEKPEEPYQPFTPIWKRWRPGSRAPANRNDLN